MPSSRWNAWFIRSTLPKPHASATRLLASPLATSVRACSTRRRSRSLAGVVARHRGIGDGGCAPADPRGGRARERRRRVSARVPRRAPARGRSSRPRDRDAPGLSMRRARSREDTASSAPAVVFTRDPASRRLPEHPIPLAQGEDVSRSSTRRNDAAPVGAAVSVSRFSCSPGPARPAPPVRAQVMRRPCAAWSRCVGSWWRRALEDQP
jgi:hypothetical protein